MLSRLEYITICYLPRGISVHFVASQVDYLLVFDSSSTPIHLSVPVQDQSVGVIIPVNNEGWGGRSASDLRLVKWKAECGVPRTQILPEQS